MQRGELRPGQRNHLGGGVELHGAGAQWNHRAIERKIAIAQLAHIAQQLRLGAMGVEYRMGQERAPTLQLAWQRVARAGFDIRVSKAAAECAPHRLDDIRRRGLVQRDAERALADPQIDLFGARAGDDLILLCACIDHHGVEECFRLWREAELAQTGRQHAGSAMHGTSDVGQSLWPVIDRIHRGDHGQEHLRGADVRGRLFATDMLLAGLQRQTVGRVPPGIDRQPDDAPRQRAF